MFSGKDADRTVPKWKQFYDGSQNKYLIPYDFLEDYTYGIKQDVRLLIKNTIDEVFNKQTNLKFLEKEEFEKLTGRVFRNCRRGESGCYNIILQFYSYFGCFSRDSHFLDKILTYYLISFKFILLLSHLSRIGCVYCKEEQRRYQKISIGQGCGKKNKSKHWKLLYILRYQKYF